MQARNPGGQKGTALDLSLMNPPPPTEAAFFHATDMEVDVDDSLIMDHEAPMEKTDTDFFNDFDDDFDDEDVE